MAAGPARELLQKLQPSFRTLPPTSGGGRPSSSRPGQTLLRNTCPGPASRHPSGFVLPSPPVLPAQISPGGETLTPIAVRVDGDS